MIHQSDAHLRSSLRRSRGGLRCRYPRFACLVSSSLRSSPLLTLAFVSVCFSSLERVCVVGSLLAYPHLLFVVVVVDDDAIVFG